MILAGRLRKDQLIDTKGCATCSGCSLQPAPRCCHPGPIRPQGSQSGSDSQFVWKPRTDPTTRGLAGASSPKLYNCSQGRVDARRNGEQRLVFEGLEVDASDSCGSCRKTPAAGGGRNRYCRSMPHVQWHRQVVRRNPLGRALRQLRRQGIGFSQSSFFTSANPAVASTSGMVSTITRSRILSSSETSSNGAMQRWSRKDSFVSAAWA